MSCKFFDRDEDEKVLDSATIQSVGTNSESSSVQVDDSALLNNYWLNEIKSQEDTARQIMTICIFLLGASITLITGNTDKISLSLANSSAVMTSAHNESDPIYTVVYFFGFVIGMTNFFIVWMVALNVARKALRLDPITCDSKSQSIDLEHIAGIKYMRCKDAIYTLIGGIVFLIVLIIGLMMTSMKIIIFSKIGALLVLISSIILIIFLRNRKLFIIIFSKIRKFVRY